MTKPDKRIVARLGLAASALALLAVGAAAAATQTKDQKPMSLQAQAPRQVAASAAPAGGPAAQPRPAQQLPQLSYMQLQAQYRGPLQDTVIQRWRDPIDGTTCYIYLPVVVQHSPPTPSGAVQYGGNTIGTISCLAGKF